MVLSKVDEGGKASTSTTVELTDQEKEKFLKLLHEYKALECGCCNQLLGFVHRVTGALACTPNCNKVNTAIAGALSPSPAPTTPALIKVESKPVENGYKNVSTVRKYEEKAGPSPAAAPSPSSVGKATDSVDHGASSSATSSPKPILLPKVTETPSSQKNENDLISASNIRKPGLNPFCRNMPSMKDGEEVKPKSQVVDENVGIDSRSNPAPVPGSSTVEKVEDVTGSRVKPSTPIEQPAAVPPVLKQRNPFANKGAAAAAPSPTVDKPKPRFKWQSCQYSPSLEDGAAVKTSFMWNVNLLQIVADKDEQLLVAYQKRISEHVKNSEPMTRPPIVDEMVIADYGGEWYRARVTEVSGDKFSVIYVDFGDAQTGLKHTDFYDMTAELMQDPIYSAMVRLDGVAKLEKKVKAGSKLAAVVYSPLQLEMVERIDNSECKEDFKAVLWLGSDKHLNEVVSEVLLQMDTAGAQSKEFESRFMSKAADWYVTAQFNERNQKKNKDAPKYTPKTLAKLGDKVTYKITDTPLLDTLEDGLVHATVTHSRGLDAIYVAPIRPEQADHVQTISDYAETVISLGELSQKSFTETPVTFDMFLVKWLEWKEIHWFLDRMKMTIYHKKRSGPKFNEPCYAPMKQRRNPWAGKWLRAFYRNKVSGDTENNEVDCHWYCLVDIGITIPVPNKYVYRVDFNFMVPPAYTFCIRLILNGVGQHTKELHQDAAHELNKQPSIEIKFQIVGSHERCLDVLLVEPTEADFLAKLPSFRKTKDLWDDRSELLRSSTILDLKAKKLNDFEFKLAVLNAIKASFEEKSKREEQERKQDMNPFQSSTHVKLGGYKGMKMELVPSS